MSDTPTPRMSACTETCDELGFPTDAYDVGCQLECELTAANERIDKLTAQLATCRKSLGEAMAYVHYNDVEDDADWQRWKRDRDGTEGAAP
jgi:hypothetical protein